jgi:hypothetical protein
MDNLLYRNYEKLVEITVLGLKFQVPESNTCLRAFQHICPETIPYGRFCWNQERQLCRVVYTVAGQPVSTGIKGDRNHRSDGSQVLRASSAGTR